MHDQTPTTVAGTSETPSTDCSPDWNRTTAHQAASAARGLAGCWRKNEAHDPDTFAVAVTAVLQLYSPDIVQYVCDPRTGLPTTCKWAPEIYEVHQACRERAASLANAKRLKNWGKNYNPDLSDADNERMRDQGRLPALPPPPVIRPTLQAMKAKHGENWGLGGVLPANELMMATSGARPMTRDQAFIEQVRAEGAERRKAQAEGRAWTSTMDCPTQPEEREPARPIVAIDGTELDQGEDF